MNLLNDTTWSPVSYKNAEVIARETADELMSRLTWMTVKPAVIWVISGDEEKDSARLKQFYPEADIITSNRDPLKDEMLKGNIDIIFANMFLPWQVDNRKALTIWRQMLCPNGLLIFSTLGLDTLKECQSVSGMQLLPKLVDMHDVGDELLAVGFVDPVLEVDYYTTVYRDKSKMLSELSDSGMVKVETDAINLDQLLPVEDGAYQVTYEVIYAHAFSPLQGKGQVAGDGVVKVPLSQLKRAK